MPSKSFSAGSFEKAKAFLNKEFDSDGKEMTEQRRTNPVQKVVYDFGLTILALYIEENPGPSEEGNPNEMRPC